MEQEKILKIKEKLTPKELKALKEALAVIYLDDSSDFRNGLWEVIRILIGEEEFFQGEDFDPEHVLRVIDPEWGK